MCGVDGYDKEHIKMPHDASNGGRIPMLSTSSKELLYSIGHTTDFIDNWLQCFEVNYESRIMIHKRNMSELFKNSKITSS